MQDALEELAMRWRCARRAALRTIVSEADGDISESELLDRALAQDRPAAERHVFDNSLRLGKGFARIHQELALGQLPQALGELHAPCLVGRWRASPDEPALFLERASCPVAQLGAAACDWWREAIAGLVLGITGGIRHARHESCGHGDPRCLDVLYLEPESDLRFGPIPEHMHNNLAKVQRMAKHFDRTTEVEFMGLSEQTLYYQLKRNGCVSSISVSGLVERTLGRSFPGLRLKEISPRPVLPG